MHDEDGLNDNCSEHCARYHGDQYLGKTKLSRPRWPMVKLVASVDGVCFREC